MTAEMILHKRCANIECAHQGLQPVSNFYVRSGVEHPTNAGHYLSECKDCMKMRSDTSQPLPASVPRAHTEVFALDYLRRNHIPALPGKACRVADVDVLSWGCVKIEVKYSTIRRYNRYFTFGLTSRQRTRGLLADVVMLICDWGEKQTFHFFTPDDSVFYFTDGQRKGTVTFLPGQKEQKRHFQNRTVLTQPMMDIAQDRLTLIESARLDFASRLA